MKLTPIFPQHHGTVATSHCITNCTMVAFMGLQCKGEIPQMVLGEHGEWVPCPFALQKGCDKFKSSQRDVMHGAGNHCNGPIYTFDINRNILLSSSLCRKARTLGALV